MAVNIKLSTFIWWWLFKYGWRWFTGNTLDGQPRTDAGWFRQGHRTVDTRYPHPTKFQLMPRWKRMAIRSSITLLVPTALLGGLIAYFVWPTQFKAVSVALMMAVVVTVVWYCMKLWADHAFRKDTLLPYAQTVAPMVSAAPNAVMRDMKLSNESIRTEQIRLPIPLHYQGENKTQITKLTGARFGGEWDVSLQVRHAPYYMMLTRKPEPRGSFTYSELVELLPQQKKGHIILGAGPGNEIVTADIPGRYPHMALSMGTGGGKSRFWCNVLCQFSFQGIDDFTVCDPKKVSVAGMEEVPGLTIHRRIEDMWKVIHEFRVVMDDRYDELEANPNAKFEPKILILEEMNAFTILSSIAWEEQGGKKKEPVWNDIRLIAVMGRQVSCHLFGAWQLLLALAAGNDSQLRTQFGLKILSRFDPQAWDLLVGQKPREPSSSVPGRAVAVMEGERKRFQMPDVDPEQAMEIVRMGKAWKRHHGLLVPETEPQRKPSPRPRKKAA